MKLITSISDSADDQLLDAVFRVSVRGIILNKNGDMALMHVKNQGYYKLPGGGLESEESLIEAISREILEETGCKIDEVFILGYVHEVRSRVKLIQTSYCFTGVVSGEIKKTNFTKAEQTDGFELLWVSPAKALELINNSKSNYQEIDFVIRRDTSIIAEAMNGLINSL
ncbi:MAG: NUDIX domain-containing protein [Candidatus Dojkabacteria bacterium]|uniref:RNA pyrophosphohydrolase n=2 Tax=Candidatus Dojkabacteria TaxID=74243 RepID=A0A136KKP6_9BACT|nr:MAG: RNA pyrophosphohydrolase [candidate division WS6 bacterium OLB21]MBW7953542.1 NUDIX domain-containing protein [Candidatus Dojkabacteria bacterium]WKZ27817.1 MAG: NUDIX domain-containing protein [Candidatus Dojkabacteria bacterium]